MCLRIAFFFAFTALVRCSDTAIEIRPCRVRRIVHRLEVPNCIAKRLLSLACRGQCASYTQFVSTTKGVERVCKCCQAENSTVRRVRVMCRAEAGVGTASLRLQTRVVQVALPTGCMCRPCAAVGDKVPDVLNPTQHRVLDMLTFEKRHS